MIKTYDFLSPSIPDDHCRQCSAIMLAKQKVFELQPQVIVDLGCGAGNSYDVFKSVAKNSSWIGVDIEESPEVAARVRIDADFLSYNGVDLPFEAECIDFIFSNQVLEHVRYPEQLLKDVCRVLQPGGLFIGQTSHLEPYHSYSYWNFTPFGFKTLCEAAGLTVIELRPGIDGQTLVQRTYLGKPKELSKYFGNESPLNIEIEEKDRKNGRSNRVINYDKLMLCGQFSFICTK